MLGFFNFARMTMLISTALLVFLPLRASFSADFVCGMGLLIGMVIAFVLYFMDASTIKIRTFFEANQTEPAINHADLRLKVYLTSSLSALLVGTMFLFTTGLSIQVSSCLAVTALAFIGLGFMDLKIFFTIRRNLDR